MRPLFRSGLWRCARAAGVPAMVLMQVVSCDPCFGTPRCSGGSPRLVIDGQLVEASQGAGQDGVTIDVVRTGGVALEQDSARVRTESGGHWRLDLGATAAGNAVVDVIVTPPSPYHTYRVSGLRLHTVEREGDAQVLDRWVVNPYYPIQFEFFYRTDPNSVVKTIVVDFHRTGGVELTDSIYRTTTDLGGRAQLFLYNDFPKALGDVVGDLTVFLPEPFGPSITRAVRLGPPTYLFRAPIRVVRLGAGPSLGYVAQIYNRATGMPWSGVRVDVQRTGGISVDPASFSLTSDANGIVNLRTCPLATGALQAQVTLRPPPPGSPVVMNISLATFDSDVGRLFANWSVGPYLPYYGIVSASGQNLVNVPIDVRRTDGIGIDPTAFTVRTNVDGVFIVSPVPLAVGDVVLELTIRPQAPFASFVVRNVRLSAVEQDFPQGKAIWVWDLARLTGPPGSVTVPLSP